MAWLMSSKRTRGSGAAGDGGHDRDLIVGLDRRVEAIDVTDVLVLDIDVDEAADLPVIEELLTETGVLVDQRGEDLADGRAVGVDLAGAVGVLAQDGGNANGGHGVLCLAGRKWEER